MTPQALRRKTGSPDLATVVACARRTLATQEAGVAALAAALDGPLGSAFHAAVERLIAARGRVIVSGMGKSGHIGRKIAATFASTGTPAFFVHPSEASHGDLGMITEEDVIVAISWSGETAELGDLIAFSRRYKVPLVAVTSAEESSLARRSDVALVLPKVVEACPHGLAPTTSTLIQLALGDALAIALLESRGFTPSQFRVFHPGGKLGARLATVDDLMHRGEALPLVAAGTRMGDAILTMSGKSLGCVGVVEDGRLVGIITDGDLRRHMSPGLTEQPVEAVMTRTPRSLPRDTLASSALELMNSAKITAVFILEDGQPVGLIQIHDLLRAGIA